MTAVRASEAGFTLIETLVALTVLAVGSVTLLIGVERHAAGVGGLSDRIVARWVAENALDAARLGLAREPDWTRAYDIDWSVDMRVRALEGTGLEAVTANVAPFGTDASDSIASLTGYMPAGRAGALQ